MTYRAAAVVTDAPQRPPKILGFALYVAGVGAVMVALMNLANVAQWALRSYALATPVRMIYVVGQIMLLLGFAIAWRTTPSWHRRLFALATAACIAILGLQFHSFLPSSLQEHRTLGLILMSGSIFARATAFGAVAYAVFVAGRAFAARTWATTLGAALVACPAWESAWPIVVPVGRVGLLQYSQSTGTGTPYPLFTALGGALFGAGLFAAGRAILRDVTIAEYLHAKAPRLDAQHEGDHEIERDRDLWTPALRSGLPLLADAVVASVGITVAQAFAVATAHWFGRFVDGEGIVERGTMGGHLAAGVLLVLALRRLGRLGARPKLAAYGALGARLLAVALLAFASAFASYDAADVGRLLVYLPALLVTVTLFSTVTALSTFQAGGDGMTALQKRLRATAILHGVSTAFTLLATQMNNGPRPIFELGALLAGMLALVSAALATAHVRRVEVRVAA